MADQVCVAAVPLIAGISDRAAGSVQITSSRLTRALCFFKSQQSYADFLGKLDASNESKSAVSSLKSIFEREGINDINCITQLNPQLLLELRLSNDEMFCLVQAHDAWFRYVQETFTGESYTPEFFERCKETLCGAGICSLSALNLHLSNNVQGSPAIPIGLRMHFQNERAKLLEISRPANDTGLAKNTGYSESPREVVTACPASDCLTPSLDADVSDVIGDKQEASGAGTSGQGLGNDYLQAEAHTRPADVNSLSGDSAIEIAISKNNHSASAFFPSTPVESKETARKLTSPPRIEVTQTNGAEAFSQLMGTYASSESPDSQSSEATFSDAQIRCHQITADQEMRQDAPESTGSAERILEEDVMGRLCGTLRSQEIDHCAGAGGREDQGTADLLPDRSCEILLRQIESPDLMQGPTSAAPCISAHDQTVDRGDASASAIHLIHTDPLLSIHDKSVCDAELRKCTEVVSGPERQAISMIYDRENHSESNARLQEILCKHGVVILQGYRKQHKFQDQSAKAECQKATAAAKVFMHSPNSDGTMNFGDGAKGLWPLERSSSSYKLMSDVAAELFPLLKLRNAEGIMQQSPRFGEEGEDQIEHIDIGGGYPCLEVNCPVSCRCNLAKNFQCYNSDHMPRVLWMSMEGQKKMALNVFIGSHNPALKCMEYFVSHSKDFRETWIRRNPADSDLWLDKFLDDVQTMLLAEFEGLKIQGKRLLVTEDDLVIMHGLLVHSGSDVSGARLFAMLLSKLFRHDKNSTTIINGSPVYSPLFTSGILQPLPLVPRFSSNLGVEVCNPGELLNRVYDTLSSISERDTHSIRGFVSPLMPDSLQFLMSAMGGVRDQCFVDFGSGAGHAVLAANMLGASFSFGIQLLANADKIAVNFLQAAEELGCKNSKLIFTNEMDLGLAGAPFNPSIGISHWSGFDSGDRRELLSVLFNTSSLNCVALTLVDDPNQEEILKALNNGSAAATWVKCSVVEILDLSSNAYHFGIFKKATVPDYRPSAGELLHSPSFGSFPSDFCSSMIDFQASQSMKRKRRRSSTEEVPVEAWLDLGRVFHKHGFSLACCTKNSVLGKGGYGTVLKLYHADSKSYVAAKIQTKSTYQNDSNNPLMRECSILGFCRSSRVLRSRSVTPELKPFLNNASFAQIFTPSGITFDVLMMECLDGDCTTLMNEFAEFLAKEQQIPDRYRLFFRELIVALSYLHGHGLAHNDLKPSNVLIVKKTDGTISIRLGDWGLGVQGTGGREYVERPQTKPDSLNNRRVGDTQPSDCFAGPGSKRAAQVRDNCFRRHISNIGGNTEGHLQPHSSANGHPVESTQCKAKRSCSNFQDSASCVAKRSKPDALALHCVSADRTPASTVHILTTKEVDQLLTRPSRIQTEKDWLILSSGTHGYRDLNSHCGSKTFPCPKDASTETTKYLHDARWHDLRALVSMMMELFRPIENGNANERALDLVAAASCNDENAVCNYLRGAESPFSRPRFPLRYQEVALGRLSKTIGKLLRRELFANQILAEDFFQYPVLLQEELDRLASEEGIICQRGIPDWDRSQSPLECKTMALVPDQHSGAELQIREHCREGDFLGYYAGQLRHRSDDIYTMYGLPIGNDKILDGGITSEFPLQRYIDTKSLMSFANSCREDPDVGRRWLANIKFIASKPAFQGSDGVWRRPMYAACDLAPGDLLRWDYNYLNAHHTLREVMREKKST